MIFSRKRLICAFLCREESRIGEFINCISASSESAYCDGHWIISSNRLHWYFWWSVKEALEYCELNIFLMWKEPFVSDSWIFLAIYAKQSYFYIGTNPFTYCFLLYIMNFLYCFLLYIMNFLYETKVLSSKFNMKMIFSLVVLFYLLK